MRRDQAGLVLGFLERSLWRVLPTSQWDRDRLDALMVGEVEISEDWLNHLAQATKKGGQ